MNHGGQEEVGALGVGASAELRLLFPHSVQPKSLYARVRMNVVPLLPLLMRTLSLR